MILFIKFLCSCFILIFTAGINYTIDIEIEMIVDRVSRMDALLFALTLEVVLQQMRIHEGSTELRLFCKPVDSRFGTAKLQYDKLVKDRNTVKDVIRRSLIELAESGEWSTLKKAVGILEHRVASADAKMTNHQELLAKRERILDELRFKRNNWVVNLKNADLKIAFLQDKIKDDSLNATTRLRYAETWLSARLEAQELRFQQEWQREKPLPRADLERRIHEEITKAFQLQIKEREEAVEHWRVKYADDTALMNIRLTDKRHELQVVSAKHDELQKLFDLHEGEMRSWISFKEQRAARIAREERARRAVTHIQAWWRGVMVRRALGAFKYLRNVKKPSTKSKKK